MNKKGYYVSIGETFGAAQRGGPVFSNLRISEKHAYGPLVPEGRGHVVLSLEPLETLRILSVYGNREIVTVSNSQPVYPVGVLARRQEYPGQAELEATIRKLSKSACFLNATNIALDLGAPIVANIVMMGALAGAARELVSLEDIEQEIKDSFGGDKADLNLKALKLGYDAVA